MVYYQELQHLIREEIIPYISNCRRLLSGTKYAIQFIRTMIDKIAKTSQNLQDLKDQLIESVDEFIKERIIYAQDTLLTEGLKLFSRREEVILVYGNQES